MQEVFTPIKYCYDIIEQFHLLDKLQEGCTFFDPTGGTGNFILAFMHLMDEYRIPFRYLNNLYYNDIDPKYVKEFLYRADRILYFPRDNVFNQDIILDPVEKQFDYIITTPPWSNFADLPSAYKEAIRNQFVEYGLVQRHNALLGSSRIDISALILYCTISNNLNRHGKVIAFLPASLFHNQGASNNFRQYRVRGSFFSLDKLIHWRGVFKSVNIRYLLAHFTKDKQTQYPVPYYDFTTKWERKKAWPAFTNYGPLYVSDHKINVQYIVTPRMSKPRQGVNTCGANDVFIFDTCKKLHKTSVLENESGAVEVESQFVYPLLTRESFRTQIPNKYIILCYLNKALIQNLAPFPYLKKHLTKYQERLTNRKGIMLNAKEIYWNILGVGEYTFAPCKIIWEATGEKFNPKLFVSSEHIWIPNQSSFAYLPFYDATLAERICYQLSEPWVNEFLTCFNTQGTVGWAQPGRIMNLLTLA